MPFQTPQDQPQKQRLSALRERTDTPHGRAYSFVVRKLRWMLPLIAMAIVLVLLIWPRIQAELENMRFKVQPIDKKVLEQAATETQLIAANFSSTDGQGRPYTMLADRAVQLNDNPDVILLENPRGTLQTGPEETLAISSRTGNMQQEKKFLTLNDNVIVSRSDGTEMKTSLLYIDLQTNDTRTDQPVRITGPEIELDAMAMETFDGTSNTVFTGPAKLILKSKTSINPRGGS